MIATAKQLEILMRVFTNEAFLPTSHREIERKGVTSNELESEFGLNRGTFSDNKKALIDKHLMKQTEVQAGTRKWTYYKTTPLGKVLAMKSWVSRNRQVDSKRPPKEIVEDVSFRFSLYANDLENSKKRKQPPADKWERLGVKQRDIFGAFFQYLPRLEKYNNLLNNQSMSEAHNALRLSFFDIDISSRFALDSRDKEIEEYGVETDMPYSHDSSIKFRLIRYFPLDDWNIGKMFEYILDLLTFIFLKNLKITPGDLDKKNDKEIAKILNDSEIKSFHKNFERFADKLGKLSLNFLSDDN